MKQYTKMRLIGAAIGIVGFVAVTVISSAWLALAITIMMWGNNVERRYS